MTSTGHAVGDAPCWISTSKLPELSTRKPRSSSSHGGVFWPDAGPFRPWQNENWEAAEWHENGLPTGPGYDLPPLLGRDTASENDMNGADRLCDVLLANDVDVCFANPGTSEMHFVAALDRKPRMRCVLGLFEGVVTGAADGYARMADKPAATLLHLGPGLANGLANLHNARRAHTPMINVVGDHATYHLQHDAPLTSDIESLARPMSHWVRRIADAESVGPDTAAAYQAAMSLPGITTLILPADAAWGEVSDTAITRAAARRSGTRGGRGGPGGGERHPLGPARSPHAHRPGAAGGCARDRGPYRRGDGLRLIAQPFNGRVERGVGRVPVARVPYPIDLALEMLRDIDVLILVGARVPVAFFAYPGKPGRLVRDDCEVIELARIGQDLKGALAWLADELGVRPDRPAPVVPSAAVADTLPRGV